MLVLAAALLPDPWTVIICTFNLFCYNFFMLPWSFFIVNFMFDPLWHVVVQVLQSIIVIQRIGWGRRISSTSLSNFREATNFLEVNFIKIIARTFEEPYTSFIVLCLFASSHLYNFALQRGQIMRLEFVFCNTTQFCEFTPHPVKVHLIHFRVLCIFKHHLFSIHCTAPME